MTAQVFKDQVLDGGSLKDAGVNDGDVLVLLASPDLPELPQPQSGPVRCSQPGGQFGV